MGAPRVAARLNVLCESRAWVDEQRRSPSIAAASAAAVSAAAATAPPPPPSPPGASPRALMRVQRPLHATGTRMYPQRVGGRGHPRLERHTPRKGI